jgi:hypothetical protein
MENERLRPQEGNEALPLMRFNAWKHRLVLIEKHKFKLLITIIYRYFEDRDISAEIKADVD